MASTRYRSPLSTDFKHTPATKALRVVLVDDHTLFRSGLRELLQRRGVEVCAETGDAEQCVALAMSHAPDVVLLDLRMPGTDGLMALKRMHEQCVDRPVVVLTTSNEERDLVEALRNKARGYLLKDIEPDALIDSLHRVVGGETVVTPEMAGVLARYVQGDTLESSKNDSRFATLTPRELEILCHLAEGQSNKVIARELGITDGTVKLHVRAILRKLELHSRVEAAVLAVESGICQH